MHRFKVAIMPLDADTPGEYRTSICDMMARWDIFVNENVRLHGMIEVP